MSSRVAHGLFAAVLLALMIPAGCSFILGHTLNVSAVPNIEAVALPQSVFALDEAAGPPASGKWVMVSFLKAGAFRNSTEPNGFDLSPILAMDPFGNVWSPPLPTAQAVFVPAASYERLKANPEEWDQRFVIELAINRGPEGKTGIREASRLASEDPAKVICQDHLTRQIISATPADLVYESRFADCPDFGLDRVVLTREAFGNWDAARGSQAIFSFSYEALGDRLSPLQRREGNRLIWAPRLLLQEPPGEKHPILLVEQLDLVPS